MPLFEYCCTKCQNRFETLTRSGEEVRCPRCGDSGVERQLSVFAVSSAAAPAKGCPGGGCALPEMGGGCAGGGCPFH